MIEVDDVVIVTRDERGQVELDQALSRARTGVAGGAVWGGLIGLLLFAPLLGMAIGAATGAAVPNKLLENIDEPGKVIHTSLTNEAEARLSEALAAAATPA